MSMGSCNRIEKGVCAQEEKSIFTVKRRKREGASIYREPTTKRIYSAIKITIDLISPFCSKKGWKKENSTRLLLYKSVDSKKQILFTPNHRYPRWSRKEDIYET